MNVEHGTTFKVQWYDGAGIHEAHTGSDLNASTTLAIALKHTGGAEEIAVYVTYPDGKVRLEQRFS